MLILGVDTFVSVTYFYIVFVLIARLFNVRSRAQVEISMGGGVKQENFTG